MAVHFDLCRKLRRKVFSRRGFVSTGDVDYNEEVTDEHRQLRGGESVFHCPFSHPSYRDVDSPFIRDVDESAPVPQPVYTPYIPKLLLGQSKRTISLKSKYVGQSYGVLPYPTVVPQIRVDATYWVSDYALSVVSSRGCSLFN